jgi:hypothetical protein
MGAILAHDGRLYALDRMPTTEMRYSPVFASSIATAQRQRADHYRCVLRALGTQWWCMKRAASSNK